jgi:N-acetylglucosaminyldiphosphoundecaprenol N-acetyl-beta-D-mannosaminyltransferase
MSSLSRSESVLSFPVTTLGVSEAVALVHSWIKSPSGMRYVVCANPHSLVTAKRDPAFSAALTDSDLSIPDGIGIVLASRISGGSIRTRITGYDIFAGICRALDREGGRSVFFLGASEDTLRIIRDRFHRDYPQLTVAGTYSPPFAATFSADEDAEMIRQVNAAKPDVLFVGMTAPKQEKWIHQHRNQLQSSVALAIGAVFDFYSGRIKRSHPAFQRAGLEWLPRLLREPRRLWRRNLVSSPVFVWRVLVNSLFR